MYHHIKGTLVHKYPAEAVIDAGGVGYQISISLNTFDKLPETGNQAKLLTYLHVKEDIMQLFGFASEKERKVFKILIGVSGIGPKLALTVLSHMAPEDLEQAVANQDMTMLTAISGVGKKTAERLLVELKGKIAEAVVEGLPTIRGQGAGTSDPVIEALMTLGLNYAEAKNAVEKAKAKLGDKAPVEQLIREALKGK
ncbi:MAG: Holliday junction branch migration protein RuvA [Candidatus Edwardsbacteria bacterium]|nr:Holliday junction branch migration protein RuvA [Candidatus Edwardsbacteria bacterium]MBU1576346.1 Holliday junction branch migration protein RuvA [Candidatus Edwardsbacteria bacterium]MBU2462899.1 Holliday junction branch migration protein RuvA [Candidatus Edwardsbacteria bacterium]MBU2593958.1 Holliday junction branch migration protein RuvA [Candidatus Edwardsbacteria bacterium]